MEMLVNWFYKKNQQLYKIENENSIPTCPQINELRENAKTKRNWNIFAKDN
jgi:hypothetical protein